MSYCIPDNYVARLGASQDFLNENKQEDQYQREVYLTALRLANQHHYQNVVDVGCGSGWKLVHHLGHLQTLGIDLPPTVEYLKAKYPERQWEIAPSYLEFHGVDLVICSDVIEHVDNPDELCNFLRLINPKHYVISTPDRSLLNHVQPEFGPPRNKCHVREWTFSEFGEYMRSRFAVDEHFYSNKAQVTQCVVARLK